VSGACGRGAPARAVYAPSRAARRRGAETSRSRAPLSPLSAVSRSAVVCERERSRLMEDSPLVVRTIMERPPANKFAAGTARSPPSRTSTARNFLDCLPSPVVGEGPGERSPCRRRWKTVLRVPPGRWPTLLRICVWKGERREAIVRTSPGVRRRGGGCALHAGRRFYAGMDADPPLRRAGVFPGSRPARGPATGQRGFVPALAGLRSGHIEENHV
jgi:hypothetical protein